MKSTIIMLPYKCIQHKKEHKKICQICKTELVVNDNNTLITTFQIDTHYINVCSHCINHKNKYLLTLEQKISCDYEADNLIDYLYWAKAFIRANDYEVKVG